MAASAWLKKLLKAMWCRARLQEKQVSPGQGVDLAPGCGPSGSWSSGPDVDDGGQCSADFQRRTRIDHDEPGHPHAASDINRQVFHPVHPSTQHAAASTFTGRQKKPARQCWRECQRQMTVIKDHRPRHWQYPSPRPEGDRQMGQNCHGRWYAQQASSAQPQIWPC